jgi:hypothetical protein
MGKDAYSLGYFLEAVEGCRAIKDGFRLDLVMFVPWGWQIIDRIVSRYGWVVHLWDGRRIYLEYRVDESGCHKPEGLVLRPLHPYQLKPDLPDPAVHWFEPRHVNLALGLDRVRPAQPAKANASLPARTGKRRAGGTIR